MAWLSQNWIWIAFAAGVFLLMRRGGMGCGMGHSHSQHDHPDGQHEHGESPTAAGNSANGGAANPTGQQPAQPRKHHGCC